MKGLRFERRGDGNYYKLILHIGDTYVPVSDEIIESLKAHVNDTPDRFLSIFLDKLGYSSYLRDQIQKTLTEGGDTASQLTALQQTLKEG